MQKGAIQTVQILAHSNPRGRTSIRSLFPALAFLVLAIGGAACSRAQSCDNVDSIYAGGLYCIAATGVTGNNPQMPVLTYFSNVGNGSTCDTSEYLVELDFAQPGDSYSNGESYGLYDSGPIAANVQWVVDWSQNQGDIGEYSEGGNGWIDVYENGNYYDGFDFNVWGQNPTYSSITTYLRSGLNPPWWYGHALTKESSNQQFIVGTLTSPTAEYFGTPLWGYPDGFGLSQLEGSAHPNLLTDDSLWTWTTNLMYGVQVANSTQSAASSHFANQMLLMYSYTSGNGLSPNYPTSIGGYCNFSWNGTGNNAFWNADWINYYNGGPWETWTGSGWSYGNSTNPTYTIQVCNLPSWTI
jgi:hypothetical protein